MLRANGCKVLGIDFDEEKLKLADSYGAETFNLSDNGDIFKYAHVFSRNRGVDSVIITASSKSNDIINNAAKMCRKRARIVLVGVTGLNISRNNFYEKELTFQVSCSYGPGRYDVNYEEKGLDYPIGFVRWTQNRNFEAIIDLLHDSKIDFQSLVSHKFKFAKAKEAYDLIISKEASLGIVLEYPNNSTTDLSNTRFLINDEVQRTNKKNEQTVVSFIGAGNYARLTLIPAFKK